MVRFKASLLAAALIFAPAPAVLADATTDAWSALEQGDFVAARELMTPLAENGAAWAQVNLGLIFAQGQGVEKDITEAMKWFRMAAEQGEPTAQHCLGMIFEEGRDVAADYAEAEKWYSKAADQGMVWAQRHLGLMHLRGHGIPQDNVQAHFWLGLAADAGDNEARMGQKAAATCMSDAELSEAGKLARDWMAKHQK